MGDRQCHSVNHYCLLKQNADCHVLARQARPNASFSQPTGYFLISPAIIIGRFCLICNSKLLRACPHFPRQGQRAICVDRCSSVFGTAPRQQSKHGNIIEGVKRHAEFRFIEEFHPWRNRRWKAGKQVKFSLQLEDCLHLFTSSTFPL